MALPDLTGINIEDSYQRVVHTDGTNYYDGTGSLLNIGDGASDFPYTGSAIISGALNVIGEFTASGFNYPTVAGNEGEAIVIDQDGNLVFASPKAITERVKNISGGPLLKGTPVHATSSGTQGNIVGVIVADASDPEKMPATYVLNEDLADEVEGEALVTGFIQGVDTRGLTEGEIVYVAEGGGWTQTKPTGSGLIQNLGIVTKVAQNGSGVVLGAGRSNDVPNLPQGYTWVGNSDSVATPTLLSSVLVETASYALYAISASHEITYELSSSYAETASYAGNFEVEGNIVPTTHLNSNLGNDDNYFLTASIGHVRTFDSTIEFVDPVTKAQKGTLQVTDSGLEVKGATNALTTISASNAKVTNKLQAGSVSADTYIGLPDLDEWSGTFTGSAEITGSLTVEGPLTITGSQLITEDITSSGTLRAKVKSFDIEHPTKPGKRLVYGALEGPEHGVYCRGRANELKVKLPPEWSKLIVPSTITVQISSAGKFQPIYFKEFISNWLYFGCDSDITEYDFFWEIKGARADVPKLKTTQ